MEGYVSPPLSYSAVCQIPNSNSSPPNSNLPNSVQNPDQLSVQNSGSSPEVIITGSNSVVPVDSEMSGADDPSDETPELTLDELRALKKLLSPANVKRIGPGRVSGDLKSKGRKNKI